MSDIVNTFVFPIIRRDFILMALNTLHQMTPQNYRVIVIDQTQPDAEFENKLRAACDIHIKPKVNYGFAQAANLGFRMAPTKYVSIVNDDVEFIWDGWWQGIEETFALFPRCVAVCPTTPREAGWGYGKPGTYPEMISYTDAMQNAEVLEALIKEKQGGGEKPNVMDGFACWCAILDRARIEENDLLFDERFYPGGGEDYDWLARVYGKGYRALGTSLSWVWHWWGKSKDDWEGSKATALPDAHDHWNLLSGPGGLWEPDCHVYGENCRRKDPVIHRALL